jgi:exopolysaccharide production protein ExoZ
MNRLHNLDYLRGLAAFGIMLYHHLSWTTGKMMSDSFMGRVGVYGVSIFYVLSGLTLYFVYFDKMTPTRKEILAFTKKRIFRIFPLLWLATFAAILLSGVMPDLMKLFLNLTGLFGFLKWDAYFSPGIWSIGNELVFYVFFPFFILFSKSFKPLMIALSAIIVGIYIYFAFFKLNQNIPISEQWKDYINPLNQVFLFLGGYLIGYFFRTKSIPKIATFGALGLGISLFVFYPVSGDPIHLVTGVARLVFTLCCFLVCFSFFKLTIELPSLLHKLFSFLGEASYSVYLLHPLIFKLTLIAFTFCGNHFYVFPNWIQVVASIASTLVISYFVYHYFEKYFMKLGRSKTPI